ncbi:hypothetical protein LJC56_05620 [Christensenellaceae bacterium OttesenSCG-928-K19]|nr:hypothetical protein [Christensenellaceae bacterium OttesenSCG-928-K19]
MTMNKYLVNRLVTWKPLFLPEKELLEWVVFTDEVGKKINNVAHSFNAKDGCAEQLQYAVKQLIQVWEKAVSANRIKEKIEHNWIRETGWEYEPGRRKRLDSPDGKYLMVRLNDEQYTLLREHMELTSFRQTLIFRKLIDGVPLEANFFRRHKRDHYTGVNMINSNIRQIARNPKALRIDEGSVKQLEFLINKIMDITNGLFRFNVIDRALGLRKS